MTSNSPNGSYSIETKTTSIGLSTHFRYSLRNSSDDELCAVKASYVSNDQDDLGWTTENVDAAEIFWSANEGLVAISEIHHNYQGTVFAMNLDGIFSSVLSVPVTEMLSSTGESWNRFALSSPNGWSVNGELIANLAGMVNLNLIEDPSFPYQFRTYSFSLVPESSEGYLKLLCRC